MTGAYLFGKDEDGKRVPIEVEHLSREERKEIFSKKDNDELISWIEMLCKNIKTTEHWLNTLEYENEDVKKDFFST